MTEFEYFSAMIAVILALGVTHILGQVGRLAQDFTIAKLYWVHAVWVILVLLSHFAAWWNIWLLRDSLSFSHAGFLYILLGPTALFLAARVLVPRLADSKAVDLEKHYYSVNGTFFPLMVVFFLWPSLMGVVMDDTTSVLGVLRHLLLVVPILACAISENRRLHAIVSVFGAALFAMVIATG